MDYEVPPKPGKWIVWTSDWSRFAIFDSEAECIDHGYDATNQYLCGYLPYDEWVGPSGYTPSGLAEGRSSSGE